MAATHFRARGVHQQSLVTEEVYLPAMGRVCPASAVEVAALASKMGSFPWKCVEYKEQNGFVFVLFCPGTAQTGYNLDCGIGDLALLVQLICADANGGYGRRWARSARRSHRIMSTSQLY